MQSSVTKHNLQWMQSSADVSLLTYMYLLFALFSDFSLIIDTLINKLTYYLHLEFVFSQLWLQSIATISPLLY